MTVYPIVTALTSFQVANLIGFEALLEDAYVKKHATIFKGYLDYFEHQWVGKKVTVRRGKSGATAPWNFQSACLKGEMKTISTLEV
ncbi:hypothetical protein DSO57_1014301 [Entomophthora muscae]|uniref:Uncharacterized protein n=1 Tax=Entomophthora muscae TaxID=34485 RepID=A0ACC2RWQ5_9FUNG|nr:hypothetical protein DSO57_1014301 [Entomophthora muscae]